MDPALLTLIKASLTELLKEIIPDKDIRLMVSIDINISKPK